MPNHRPAFPSGRAGILEETFHVLFPLLILAELPSELLQHSFLRLLQRGNSLLRVLSKLPLGRVLLNIALNTLHIGVKCCGLQDVHHWIGDADGTRDRQLF